MNKKISLIIGLLISVSLSAQNKVWDTFEGTRVMNNHSTEMLYKRNLEFIIAHKFGDIAGSSGGLQNFYGFDNVAVGYNKTRLLAHSIFPPMHLNAFSPSSIPMFALRSLFDVVSIETPGIFDVDIVKLSCDELDDNSLFQSIKLFDDNQLAHIQSWLQALKASVHMEVVLKKYK